MASDVPALQLYFSNQPSQYCPRIADLSTPAGTRLASFYATRQYQPRWTAAEHSSLQEQIAALADDGMPPGRYPLAQQGSDLCQELLASQSWLQALDELANGILPQPLPAIWHAEGMAPQRIDALSIANWTAEGDIAASFEHARPALPFYRTLRQHYAILRHSAPAPWPRVSEGRLLRNGSNNARVAELALRLAAEGYLDAATAGLYQITQQMDEPLSNALQHFQRRHSLQDDGVLGPDTLRELNVSARSRIEQVRINLERWRWLQREMEGNLLLVDIAGGEGTLFQRTLPVWQTRLQVGRPERQTPQLKSRISRLTLNPTWTVPPTILRKDKLPLIRKDPGYLARQRIRVLDSRGRQLDPHTIDWSSPGGITLRQDAGPGNALGQIAFRFSNPFSVYLHDTPSQSLFDKRPRVFSSGCVRVENANQLRDQLTSWQQEDERAEMLQLHESGRTTEYRLQQGTSVLIAYWTVNIDAEGLIFRPDLYELDPQLQAALDRAAR